MQSRPTAAAVTVCIAALASIASSGVDPGEDPSVALEACAGDNDITDSVVIAEETEQSMHELVQCGGLTFALLNAVITSAWVIASEGDAAPEAFAFQDGAYKTTGTGMQMDITFVAGSDTPGFTSGDPIGADLFSADSYLVGADGTRDGAEVTVTFTGTGPLVSLLGKGDSPTSPLVFTDADLTAISATLSGLRTDTVILLDDVREKSRLTYTINVPEDDVGALLTRQGATQSTEGVDGTREDLSQTLTTTEWNISYENLGQALLGTAAFDVLGGPFDYHVQLTYSGTPERPLFAYSCL